MVLAILRSLPACSLRQRQLHPNPSDPFRGYHAGCDPLRTHGAAGRCGRWTVWFGCARTLLPVQGNVTRGVVRASDGLGCAPSFVEVSDLRVAHARVFARPQTINWPVAARSTARWRKLSAVEEISISGDRRDLDGVVLA